jgi:hypothetical protein
MARIVALVVLAVGLVLLAWMIVVEGEPGALPLGLVLLGVIGCVATRVRTRP